MHGDPMDTPTPESERRRAPRSEVQHPIRFKLFSRDVTVPPMDGCLRDISLEGARVALEDHHAQFSCKSLKGLRTKLQITLPESEETLQLISTVAWARRARASVGSELEVGLSFTDVEPWQLEKIKQFLSARHNDQTMLWNMWDSYQQYGRGLP